MKSQSSSGAAGLGSVQVAEMERLVNSFGTLDQADQAQALIKVINRLAEVAYATRKTAAMELDAYNKPTGGAKK
jgi:hypothetical protein